MYKELRSYASTDEMWAGAFLPGAGRRLRTPRALAFGADARWKAIRRHVAPGGHVLDAGCGMGEWDLWLARNGYRVTGLDYSARMIAALSKRHAADGRLRWVDGAVQSIPLPDESFDAVISWGVVEHDEAGPTEALREFHRVLKPGGYAFITVPLDSPMQRWSSDTQFDSRANGRRQFFQYFMTPDELARFVTDAGFSLAGPVRPVSRHYALLFPKAHMRLERNHSVPSRLAAKALDVIARRVVLADSMIMAIAEKP